MKAAVPTTIFTGFLGSGKTTVISHLLDDLLERGEKPVFIKNEIGSEDIDGKLFQGKNIKTKELLNGCICCTLVGPFAAAIDEVIKTTNPDRIIIEASGAADPSAIALMVSSHPKLERDGVITIIDVVNFEGYKDISETARNQARFTDLVVFNKVELADIEQKKRVVGYVRELNEHSPIVEAPGGKISLAVAFGVATNELQQLLIDDKQQGESTHEHDGEHHDHSLHLATDGLESFSVDLPEKVSRQKLEDLLNDIPSNIIRVKGFSIFDSADIQLVNKVGQRVTFIDVEDRKLFVEHGPKLVFIGFSIISHRDAITQKVKELF